MQSIAGISLALPGVAHAAAYYLQEQSVRASGRAFSGEVADDGAASLWWNPAAIGGMEGTDASAGLSVILPRADVTDNGSTLHRLFGATQPIGGTSPAINPIKDGYLPSFTMAHGIKPWMAIGLTVTSPFSFETDYSSTSWVRYYAQKTKLRTYDIQPSLAVVPLKGLSVGVALNAEYSKADITQGLPNLSDSDPDTGLMALKGNGMDIGYTVGARWKTGPLSLGVSYKSAVVHHLHGTIDLSGLTGLAAGFNGQYGVTARFSTPWQLIMGGRLAVTPQLTLNAQAIRFGWSKFDSLLLRGPISAKFNEDYKNSWSYAVGVDYAATKALTLRAGVQRDLTPTTDVTRQPAIPDTNRWNISGGASYHANRWLTLDGSFSYLPCKDGALQGPYSSLTFASGTLNGQITNARVIVMAMGASVHF